MAGINDLQHIGRHSRGGVMETTPARTLEMLLRESRAVGVDVSHHRALGEVFAIDNVTASRRGLNRFLQGAGE